MKLRGISHVLLIGDPGLGKSQILRYVQSISPRGIYTSGKGSSAAGLTASVLRDSETGEFTLEAGAIVLADRGLAAIDEFERPVIFLAAVELQPKRVIQLNLPFRWYAFVANQRHHALEFVILEAKRLQVGQVPVGLGKQRIHFN